MGRAHRWVVVVPVVGCFAIAVGLAVAAAGCDGHGPAGLPGDARADAPADAAICGPLDRQIRDALADPGSCMADSECDSVGGQLGFPTCDCAPFVVDCSGMPIASNAPGLARARMLIQQFVSAGCAVDKACDCAPRGPLHCTADHRCAAALQSCFPEPPVDAGVDAAVDAP